MDGEREFDKMFWSRFSVNPLLIALLTPLAFIVVSILYMAWSF